MRPRVGETIRILIAATFVCGGFAGEAGADPCFDTVEGLGVWFVGYYQAPEPEKLVCSLEYVAESGETDIEKRVWSTMSFYAAALEQSESIRTAFMEEISLAGSSKARALAAVAFFLMNPAVGKPLLARAAKEWAGSWEAGIAVVLAESIPEKILTRRIDSATDVLQAADALDSCWMAFLASGDPAQVRPVVDAAQWALLEKSPLQVVGRTAVWSLASHARTHPRIRLYLASCLADADRPTSTILSRILADMPGSGAVRAVQSKPDWKESGRGLRAAIVVTDKPDEFFQTFQKSGTRIPLGSCVTARKGLPVVTAVVISHCSVDHAGHCNLEADFSFKNPVGEDYAESGTVDLWVDRAAPPQSGLVLGTGYMGIVFEPHDPPGPYQVSVLVRDRVTGEALELSHTLKLGE